MYMATDWTICVIQICKYVYKFVTCCVNIYIIICPIGRLNVHDYTSLLVQQHHSFGETSLGCQIILVTQPLQTDRQHLT